VYFGNRLWAGFVVIGQVTPTAAPQTPVIYSFVVSPGQILEGQCVDLNWRFDGRDLALTRIFRNNQVILIDIPLSGSFTDCPPGTGQMEYRLVVDSEFGGSANASQFVNVLQTTQPTSTSAPTPEQPPTIDYFTIDSNQIQSGQCVNLSWSFQGTSLALAQLLRDGEVISSELANSGTQQDCPPYTGQIEYRLFVSSEFAGAVNATQYVTVLSPENTQTPEQPPSITSFTSDATEISLGSCVNLSWTFEGSSLASAVLMRNGEAVNPDITSPGSYQDCISDPALVGTVTYQIKIDSEFGDSAVDEITITVNNS
jgi:hypothetical protein